MKNMIAASLLLVLASVFQPSKSLKMDIKLNDGEFVKVCMEETGVTSEMLDKFNIDDTATGENLNCFFKCRLRKNQDINDNGEMQVDHFMKMFTTFGPSITPENIKKLTECVAKVPPIKECNDVAPVHNCLKEIDG